MRHLYTLFMPGSLVLLAGLVVLRPEALPTWVLPIIYASPYVIAAAGLFVGWFFDRGRLVFPILLLAVAEAALALFAPDGGASTKNGRIVYNAVAVLLPLNLLALSLLQERGVFIRRAGIKLAAILPQILVVWWLCRPGQRQWAAWLETGLVSDNLLAWIPLAQPAVLAFGIALCLQLVHFLRHRHAFESGFFWSLVTVFLALSWHRVGGPSTGYFATAGLILILGALESSYRMANHDELTGLPGRRALDEELKRLSGNYTIAMVDVDFFKKFNDTYGHHIGDEVLRMVASKLAENTGGGRAFRYGGEEFAMVFPGKSLDEAVPYLEVVRSTVEVTPFAVRSRPRPRKKPAKPKTRAGSGKKVTVTISIGAAERDGRMDAADKVIRAADKALYRAKQQGRNQVWY